MQNSENFRRFVPSVTFFAQFCVRNGNIFGALHHLKGAMKIFTGVVKKKQGRNFHVLVGGGGKNWNFWPKYLSLTGISQFFLKSY